MRLNNYRGTVNDRPIDTVVVNRVDGQTPQAPATRPGFMDGISAHMNNQGIVPAGNLPVYDKG